MCLYLQLNTKIRLTMLCLSGFELNSRWVPLQMIQKHSIHFYIKAISFVDDHANAEEGHYFERLWNVIFS